MSDGSIASHDMTSPAFVALLATMGSVFSLTLSAAGAAYGTAKSAAAIVQVSVMRPDLMYRAIVPTIMASVLGLYGVITNVVILAKITGTVMSPMSASLLLAAGLCTGFCSLSSGMCIGIVGDAGVRGFAQQPRLMGGMILMLIMGEVLGLYGMFMGLYMCDKAKAV